MKKYALLLLAALLALSVLPGAAEDALYRATARVTTRVYMLPDGTSESVGRIVEGERIEVLSFDPSWARVAHEETVGYVRRSSITQVTAIDPVSTPPYGVEVNRYIARTEGDTRVQASPDANAETLITLREGARLSFICVENGWAKLIFKRQYGYVDTNSLHELSMVRVDGGLAGNRTPIAAYTSFYDVSQTPVNQNRIHNIAVACARMSVTLLPGAVLNFNRDVGPYNSATGYLEAGVLVDGESALGYGGGTCQTSSTLYNVLLQLPGIAVIQRRAHGPSGAKYLPHGMDAAVGTTNLNLRFRNDYPFPVRIDAGEQDGALCIAIFKAE